MGNGQDVNIKPIAVEVAMRRLGDEFEERFKSTFADMITKLNINPGNVRRTFYVIVGETFADGINWGRIVACLLLLGYLRFIVVTITCLTKSTTLWNRFLHIWILIYSIGWRLIIVGTGS